MLLLGPVLGILGSGDDYGRTGQWKYGASENATIDPSEFPGQVIPRGACVLLGKSAEGATYVLNNLHSNGVNVCQHKKVGNGRHSVHTIMLYAVT